jgi:hypothetical protein
MNPDQYTNDSELIELRLQLHHEKCRADNLWEVVKFERAERKRLEGEVERLTKAGDAMASSIQFNEEMAKDYNGPAIVHQSVQRWNAAKEGKPQP